MLPEFIHLRMIRFSGMRIAILSLVLLGCGQTLLAAGFERVRYNHPGLKVDLGVGLWAWPLPMDYDGDGDNDLVVVCPDVPYNGAYFFENPGGDSRHPVFKPAVRIDRGPRNVQICYVDGKPRVLSPGVEYENFLEEGFAKPRKLAAPTKIHAGKIRANQWKYVDYDGDGALDLIVGIGDWSDYGWDDAFDKNGVWQRGPLHGYVYLLHNSGSTAAPQYGEPRKLAAGGKPVDVYGWPSPNFADFDGDGDLDLVCGEFLDKLTYFQNVGTRNEPQYAAGKFLRRGEGPIKMDLEMIIPVAIDWDRDGDVDLVVGDEDGRVALIEHSGELKEGIPQFQSPRYFQQQAQDVKFGALVTPCSIDWDGDGDEDLVCGNSAGYIALIENLDGGNPPRFAAPKYLDAGGRRLRIMAGDNGSIQGPCEAKWGYTTLSAADWDHDGLPDLVVNSIWGKVVWYRNEGTRSRPRLAAAQPVEVAWPGPPPHPAWNWWTPAPRELATQWRTTPLVYDLNNDGLNDLVMLDHEGFLAYFERKKQGSRLLLSSPQRIFQATGTSAYDNRQTPQNTSDGLLQLNTGLAGRSGRRKLCLTDWDGDGKVDLLVNSKSINFMRNVAAKEGPPVFSDQGPVDAQVLAGHTTSPTTVDWNQDGRRDLLVGAEDGFLYYLANPHDK